MTPIESIIYMIWRGIAVGILISAPMGPVGILCIQRTLDKGRKAGFYTGVGAAISDLFYCLLTGFGLSFIEDFLNENQNVIQLVGSVVLIAFSVYLFKKNPSSALRRPVPQNVSAKKNILGGFVFTFSNPLIIFLIIGLFARFNFTVPEINGFYYAIGYLFIIAGALGWWYGVTYVIDKIRRRFNMQTMKKMNVIIGIVILGFACVGIVTSILGLTSAKASARRMLYPLEPAGVEREHCNSTWSDSLVIFNFGEEGLPRAFKLDFKLRNNAAAPMKRYPYMDSSGVKRYSRLPAWSLVAVASAGDTLSFRISNIEHAVDAAGSQSALEFSTKDSGGHFYKEVATEGMNIPGGWNHYRLQYNPEEGATLLSGSRTLSKRLSIPVDEKKLECLGLLIAPGGSVEVKDVSLAEVPTPASHMAASRLDEMEARFSMSSDILEGRWRIFDESMQESQLKLGGDYELGIFRLPDSTYEIIYLGGALINASDWKAGMLKGRLRPTGISTVYDLEWIDPFGSVLKHRLKAQLEESDILTLQFPYQDSSLRLHRLLP